MNENPLRRAQEFGQSIWLDFLQRELIESGELKHLIEHDGLPRYRDVAAAYLARLEARAACGAPLGHVASVASFFLSRIDSLVDALLETVVQAGGPRAQLAAGLRGQVAIASAQVAYQIEPRALRPGHDRSGCDGTQPGAEHG